MEHVHADCRPVRWRSAGADAVLRRALSDHGVRPVDLPGEPARHRNLLVGAGFETLFHGLPRSGAALDAGLAQSPAASKARKSGSQETRRWRGQSQGLRHGLQNRSDLLAARGLPCSGGWAPSDVDGAISPRRSEEIFSDARNRPHELWIVWTALHDCLFLDEGLILPVQVKPRLDRDWAVYTQPLFVEQSVHKIAHFSSGIGIQPDCPLDAIRRGGVPCCWHKTPVGEPDFSHVRREKPR